jgi:hypothetical protein
MAAPASAHAALGAFLISSTANFPASIAQSTHIALHINTSCTVMHLLTRNRVGISAIGGFVSLAVRALPTSCGAICGILSAGLEFLAAPLASL